MYGLKMLSRVKLVFGIILLWAITQLFVLHVFSIRSTRLLDARIKSGIPTFKWLQNSTVSSSGGNAVQDNNGFLVCIRSSSSNVRNTISSKNSNSNKNGSPVFLSDCNKLETDGRLSFENNSDKTLPIAIGLNLRKCAGKYLTDIKFLIRGDNICETGPIDVVILIHSAISNFRQRRAIRKTWGNASSLVLDPRASQHGTYLSGNSHSNTFGRKSRRKVPVWKFQTGTFRLVFLLGQALPELTHEETNRLRAENSTFGDVVQGNFLDTYRNLSLKTIMGINWVTQWCTQAKFVLKTDDDTFVNTRNLLALVRSNAIQLDKAIGGRCSKCSNPNRRTNSKWYIAYDIYPGEFYPEFCSGIGYVMSMRVAELLRTCFEHLEIFPLEDIYVAFCMFELELKGLNFAGFYSAKPPSMPCLYKQDNLFVLTHGLSPRLLELIWTTPCDSGLAFNNKGLVNKWLAGLVV